MGKPRYASVAGRGEQLLAQTIRIFVKSWKSEAESGVTVKLGADPEFVLLSPEGKVVPASRYFPPDGAAGCDSVVVRGVRRWPLAELRPEPAAEPDALAADVRRLLATAARMTSGEPLSWLAGGAPVRGLPLGGHIHLSGAALTGERLRALDNAVALPLRLLEPPSAESRRPRYGSLGDFRKQPHGGFEYRTPPSWLVSRLVARGVMALSKVAAEHARELSAFRPLDEEAVREAFYGGDREVLSAACERVYAGIVRTSGYRSYAALIDPLFDAIRDRRTWNETDDFRRKWGIVVKL
ncbi:hypothetical protein D3H35_04555 [Cohnella faecalis]|uniref:Uncharacterized protein n=1 Tax=Cohnella faecalis TaxID=2315694 RepID=A0A398CN28_9BACL|nr:hypothetical protein D3H35_04555 [Cohnella faecalis]